MIFRLVLAALVAVIPVALAAEEAAAAENCPVKGGDGSYSYDPTSGTGPMDWGSIPDFELCGTGQAQSPIDFPLDVDYEDISMGPSPNVTGGPMDFGAGVQNWAFTCSEPGTCGYTMFDGVKFNVLNIHMHAPAEHLLDGVQYPLEAHIVHVSDEGGLAVIATMFKFPEPDTYPARIFKGGFRDFGVNPLITRMLKGVSGEKDDFFLPLGRIINPKLGYCSYVGSLTTPPCTEGVRFFMAMNIETVSRRQVHEYRLTTGFPFDGNNRPTLPLNGREVKCFI